MATTLATIITNARTTLNETAAAFWTDAELLVHAIDGVKDLWRAVIDLHQGHFETVDITNVSMAASTSTLTGVPADVFRVELIEVRDLTTTNAVQNMTFEPRKINHPDFTAARGLSAQDPSGQTIYFDILNAGAPIAAPSIQVAPQITSAVNLRLIYTPTLAAMTSASNNPIPGETDHAVMAWIIAHAKAKERPDGSPDPSWLQIYATDKKSALVALTPRQTQEPEVTEAFFESYW